jgi:hypothetical protein
VALPLLVLACGLAHAVLARPGTLRAFKAAFVANLGTAAVSGVAMSSRDATAGSVDLKGVLAMAMLGLLFGLGFAIPGLVLLAVGEYRRQPHG